MSRSAFVVLVVGGALAVALAAPAGADPITQSPVAFEAEVPSSELPADCNTCDRVVDSPTFLMLSWKPLGAPPTTAPQALQRIPEPTSFALLALGAGWLLARRTHR